MHNNRFVLKSLVGAMALALGPIGTVAAAALEEVVVTAQKREESSQSTPVSLAALGALELENKGINGLFDLRATVPSLQLIMHPNSAATTRIFLRGIGNNDDQITQDPSVAVYLDGVYMARSQGLAMDVADIERVEVLRGPQGSLYGRNATGGAVNFITKAPRPGEWGFQQTLTVGNRNLLRSRTQGNVPLGDSAALQLSYLRAEKDGFVKNLGTGVDRFGDQDRDAYRLAGLWEPADGFSIRYSYDRSNIDDTPAFLNAVPPYPQQGRRRTQGSPDVRDLQRNDIVAKGHNLQLSWDLADHLVLKSITGYRELDNETYQDYNTGVYAPAPILLIYFDSEQKQFTQELQLIGDAFDSRLEYVAGFFYMDESADSYDYTKSMSLPGGRIDRDVTIDNKAYALYTQGTYTPALLDDRLHVTLGGRVSRDERKATLLNTTHLLNAGTTPPSYTVIPGVPGSGDESFDNFSPSLIVGYDLADDINVYGKVVKGYKTGGFNVRASSTARFSEGFDEENLISYELGMKSEWWQHRLRFNAAVFHAAYDDIQINVQSDPNVPTITDVLNAGKATIDGAELDLTVRPVDSLTATLNYAYLDADFDEVKNAAGVDVRGGYRFVQAPLHTYNVNLQYDFPATPIGLFSVLVDYAWQSEKYNSPNGRGYRTDDYGLLNARLNLADIPVGEGQLRAGLWGRNMEDKEYYVDFFNGGTPSAVFGEPRSYGIDVTNEY
jgi:iron complex outermembrane receptor protein